MMNSADLGGCYPPWPKWFVQNISPLLKKFCHFTVFLLTKKEHNLIPRFSWSMVQQSAAGCTSDIIGSISQNFRCHWFNRTKLFPNLVNSCWLWWIIQKQGNILNEWCDLLVTVLQCHVIIIMCNSTKCGKGKESHPTNPVFTNSGQNVSQHIGHWFFLKSSRCISGVGSAKMVHCLHSGDLFRPCFADFFGQF